MTLMQRLARCFSVSIATTLLSAAVLVALSIGAGVRAGVANVVAVCCGIGPSYFANRHWVWQRTGRGTLSREIVPFWALSLAGLATSTVAVAWTARMTSSWSDAARAVALPSANLAVFGSLWVVQFVLLDRVLFRNPTQEEVVAS
jgi:putative flippase GtrA